MSGREPSGWAPARSVEPGRPVDALVITGPTATGKTAVAIEVAERIGGEIISLDSRQIYRGLDIGTAKPSARDRHRIPNHGLDLVEPTERFSAGRYAGLAHGWVREIRARGRVPILAGGSGFFLRALLHPIFAEPTLDRNRREALRDRLGHRPVEDLKRWLRRLDPERAEALEREGGRQRILRSLELPLLTGRSHTDWVRVPSESPPLRPLIVVLWLGREELVRRIDARVDAMVEAGLRREVEDLLRRYPADAPGLKTHGYMELVPVLRGRRSLAEGIEAVKRDTRAYARRQMTWFRHQLPRGAIFVDAGRPTDRLAEAIARWWTAQGSPRAPSVAGTAETARARDGT